MDDVQTLIEPPEAVELLAAADNNGHSVDETLGKKPDELTGVGKERHGIGTRRAAARIRFDMIGVAQRGRRVGVEVLDLGFEILWPPDVIIVEKGDEFTARQLEA